MKRKKSRLPVWAKALVAVSSVVAFFVLCALDLQVWLPSEIRYLIEKNTAGTGATVEVGRIRVNLLDRSVAIHDIRIHTQNDSTSNNPLTVVSLDAAVSRLSVSGLGYRRQNGKPALSAGAINIDSPHATLVTKKSPETQATTEPQAETTPETATKDSLTLIQTITRTLSSVSVRKISVTDLGLDYVMWTTDSKSTRVKVGGGDITLDGFVLDSLPAAPEKILFSDNITLAIDSISYAFGSGSYIARADTLKIDAAAKTFSLKWAALVPQYSKNTFAQSDPDHGDWTEALVRGIECRGVDYARLIADTALTVDSISLQGAHIASYKNRQVYQTPRNKPMLYELLHKMPVPLEVKHIAFAGVDVRYDELEAKADAPGVVIINRGRGTMTGVTNMVKDHPHFFTVDVSARLMNSGDMHAVCRFPVSPSDDYWEITGNVGKTDMTVFNAAIEPMMNVHLTSGTMNSLDFHLTGTKTRSHIALTMAYSDLKVSILRRHDHTKKQGFVDAIANMVIRNDNPGRGGKGALRDAEGNFTRDPERSMFNYMWRSFVPAIVKTVL